MKFFVFLFLRNNSQTVCPQPANVLKKKKAAQTLDVYFEQVFSSRTAPSFLYHIMYTMFRPDYRQRIISMFCHSPYASRAQKTENVSNLFFGFLDDLVGMVSISSTKEPGFVSPSSLKDVKPTQPSSGALVWNYDTVIVFRGS